MTRLLVLLVMLAGCSGNKQIPLPQVEPVKDDLSTFQAPAMYVPPPAPVVLPPPPKPNRAAPNEQRYNWEDGEAYLVQVQAGYPTVVRF